MGLPSPKCVHMSAQSCVKMLEQEVADPASGECGQRLHAGSDGRHACVMKGWAGADRRGELSSGVAVAILADRIGPPSVWAESPRPL